MPIYQRAIACLDEITILVCGIKIDSDPAKAINDLLNPIRNSFDCYVFPDGKTHGFLYSQLTSCKDDSTRLTVMATNNDGEYNDDLDKLIVLRIVSKRYESVINYFIEHLNLKGNTVEKAKKQALDYLKALPH